MISSPDFTRGIRKIAVVSVHMIDILLPTYRPQAAHLRTAIESLLKQTENRWQLWVCNEPAEDDTRAMMEPYLGDERIHWKQNTQRLGIGRNWNRCLQHGNAPYVQFLFQDDLWAPAYLETALRILGSNPGVGMVSMAHKYSIEENMPNALFYDEVQAFIRDYVPPGEHRGMDTLMQWIEWGLRPNIIGEPSFVMLRRETVRKAGRFRETMVQNIDSEFWMHMLRHGNWYRHPDTLGTFRVHPHAASAKNAAEAKGIFERWIMLRSAQYMVPPERRKHVRKMVRQHIRAMAHEFLTRYSNASIPQATSTTALIARHPIVTFRSIVRFARRRLRKPAKP